MRKRLGDCHVLAIEWAMLVSSSHQGFHNNPPSFPTHSALAFSASHGGTGVFSDLSGANYYVFSSVPSCPWSGQRLNTMNLRKVFSIMTQTYLMTVGL